MSIKSDIRRALTQSVIDLALPVTVAHEGFPFDPSDLQEFVKVHMLPTGRVQKAKSGFGEFKGVYQLSVFVKSDTGTARSDELVGIIMNTYVNNASFISGAQKVVVLDSRETEGADDDGWYSVHISVDFFSDINR